MSKLKLDPIGLGKALFATNLFFGVCFIALVSFTGMDMKSVGWNMLMGFPVIFGVCGFIYGAIGAVVYNFLSKKGEVQVVESESN